MGKQKMDLSIGKNAEISRNQTAITGLFIMNIVLVLAYLLEVVKGVRNIQSYLIVLLFTLVPQLLCTLRYLQKKDTKAVRYIGGYGFLLFYTYIMFTTSTQLTFCYIFIIYQSYCSRKRADLLLKGAGVVDFACVRCQSPCFLRGITIGIKDERRR